MQADWELARGDHNVGRTQEGHSSGTKIREGERRRARPDYQTLQAPKRSLTRERLPRCHLVTTGKLQPEEYPSPLKKSPSTMAFGCNRFISIMFLTKWPSKVQQERGGRR